MKERKRKRRRRKDLCQDLCSSLPGPPVPHRQSPKSLPLALGVRLAQAGLVEVEEGVEAEGERRGLSAASQAC